jgi:hypothetical protein
MRASLPAFAKALLLHAMASTPNGQERYQDLLRELENGLVLTENRVTYVSNHGDKYAAYLDSDTRTTALLLRALVLANPSHPLVPKLARGLIAGRKDGSFRTTQEASMTLLALSDYKRKIEGEKTQFHLKVWGDDAVLKEGSFGPSALTQTFNVAMDALQYGRVSFEKSGSGRLYYETRLTYARKELPSESLDEGFTVEKRMTPLSSGPDGRVPATGGDDRTEFAARDLVVVDLWVSTVEPRNFTVVDDPLPAGLEAVDSSLANASGYARMEATNDESVSRDDVAHDRGFLTDFTRRELRDDRVVYFIDRMRPGIYHYRYLARATTTGTFVTGPTKAEEMYAPEVFGRTGARVTRVH